MASFKIYFFKGKKQLKININNKILFSENICLASQTGFLQVRNQF